jgi:ABC-type multidrug transport system fused ATPase/permease subunit
MAERSTDTHLQDAPPRAAGLRDVWRLFDERARAGLVVVLLLNLGAAVLEAVGAGLVVPFVAMVSNPDYALTQPALHRMYQVVGATSPTNFLVITAFALLAFFLLKNLYVAVTLSLQYRFVYREMTRVSERMFAGYLRRPYEFHIQTNSAVLVRNVGNEVLMLFSNVIVPAITLFAELAVIVAMVLLLVWFAPGQALIAAVVLGGLMVGFHSLVRRRVRRYGLQQQEELAQRIKSINQGLGGIKEIKVLGREEQFVRDFVRHEHAFADASRYAMVLNQTPRIFMETVAFCALFLGVAIALLGGGDPARTLPTLALFAVAAIRLMPSANRILGAVTKISYYRPSIAVVCADGVAQPPPADESASLTPVAFEREIRLAQVSYTYPGAATASLSDVSLTIPKGASVALIGPSGAGKSTVVDIILGLLQPTSGQVLVDGVDVRNARRAWQSHLGYIPQTIYLSDDTIRRNIAFGVPDDEVDDERVWQALAMAQMKSHVAALPLGLETIIGERGVALSGGQRQRIGIARALYTDPDVLVLDEATSALDSETEREISAAIDSLAGRKTLLIVAHRQATIEKCSLRFELRQGRVLA